MRIPENFIIEILKNETGISVGCTEVAAVALAAAWARKALGEDPERIEITLDRGTLKNGMGVGIPGTSKKGIPWAAAIGATIGKPEKNLKILENISLIVLESARRLLSNNKIIININRMAKDIYINCKMKGSSATAETLIVQKHNQVERVLRNGKIFNGWKVYQKSTSPKIKQKREIKDIPFNVLIQFVESIQLEKIFFLKKGLEINKNFAIDCIDHLDELELGSILKGWIKGKKENTTRPDEYGKFITVVAVEARMRGFPKPVFTCAGSGNQGLVASLPLIGYAEKTRVSQEIFLRSLTLSFLVTIYIKSFTGLLSPICGCGIGSSIGAGCGLVYLMGGKQKEIEWVIKNMVGTAAGIICDGAKTGCAFKALLMVGLAFDSAKLAVQGVTIGSHDGIISKSVEETLSNLEHLTHFGMAHADDAILDVMNKEEFY